MTTRSLDLFFRSLLDLEGFASIDSSLNGLQVDNDGGEVANIAFAVDASLASFRAASDAGAGLLFVHHGLFWGAPLPVTGSHRERLRFLLEHNLALYAVHLPLDAHPALGNNAALAGLLGIEAPEPFGLYHGRRIGWKGPLREPLTIGEAAKRIAFRGRPALGVYPFGKRTNATCAVISGGAAGEARQAIEEGVDLYVTGESSHQMYHECMEAGLNFIAGGHYTTEVWGVRKVMEETANQLHLDVEFLDLPTGL
ncbi:MAG: Nif3-like dinuclear metal center hexameric protein [Treponematales bacterium]